MNRSVVGRFALTATLAAPALLLAHPANGRLAAAVLAAAGYTLQRVSDTHTHRLGADTHGLTPSSPAAQGCPICGSAQVFVLVCLHGCVFVVLALMGKTRRRAGLVGLGWPTRTVPPWIRCLRLRVRATCARA